MDTSIVIAAALLILAPLQVRWSLARARSSVVRRGGDVDRFDRSTGAPWVRAIVLIAPVLGCWSC